jgi:hypothetical protein
MKMKYLADMNESLYKFKLYQPFSKDMDEAIETIETVCEEFISKQGRLKRELKTAQDKAEKYRKILLKMKKDTEDDKAVKAIDNVIDTLDEEIKRLEKMAAKYL